jgi:hypothetical protein
MCLILRACFFWKEREGVCDESQVLFIHATNCNVTVLLLLLFLLFSRCLN